jgi:hypothetical protein
MPHKDIYAPKQTQRGREREREKEREKTIKI